MQGLKTGDLLWTRSEGLVGALIRFGARLKYHGWRAAIGRAIQAYVDREIPEDKNDIAWGNHIAVVIEGTYLGHPERTYVIEAIGVGLSLTPIEHYNPNQYKVLPLSAVKPDAALFERQDIAAFALRELAAKDKYGWLALFSIVLQLITPTHLDISWDGTMICSAFGARCWEHAGVVVPTFSPYTTMPADLAFMALNAVPLPPKPLPKKALWQGAANS